MLDLHLEAVFLHLRYLSLIQVILEYQNTVDPRKDVFEYAVEKGWIITEMSASKRNLEDIFRHLTTQGDVGNA